MIRIDDLQCGGLVLKQDTESYCFTSDAVLLANLVRVKNGATVADFGTGNGVIAVLLCAKTRASKIYAVEKQPGLYALTCENVALNGLDGRVIPVLADIEDAAAVTGRESIDAVVCNPPYFRKDSGEVRGGESALARHESGRGLAGIMTAAAQVLKTGGDLFMIHRTDRLAEVVALAEREGLAVKEMILVRPSAEKEPNVFVIRARKGGRQGMKLRTLTVYGQDGSYTDEVAAMYGERDE